MGILRCSIGLLCVPFFSTVALAGWVTESEIGEIFTDSDCKILTAEVLDMQFRPGPFRYLGAVMDWTYDCQVRNGDVWNIRQTESVVFPQLRYDRREKVWLYGSTPVARKTGWWTAEVLDGFAYRISSHIDERYSISFQVLIEEP